MTATLNTWFSDKPFVRNGKPQVLYPADFHPSHINILTSLARFRRLSKESLYPLVGISHGRLYEVLQKMRAAGNNYIKVCDQQRADPQSFICKPKFWELDKAGKLALDNLGHDIEYVAPASTLVHELLVNETMASLHHGAVKRQATPIYWQEIKKSKSIPKETLDDDYPHAVQVSFGLKSKTYTHNLFPDAYPFGFSYETKGQRVHSFFALEADTASETIEPTGYTRNSIETKFAGYLTALNQELYRERWGLPNLAVLFVTTFPARIPNMIALLHKMTERNPNLRRSFYFTHHPTFRTGGKPQPVDMLNRKWTRGNNREWTILEPEN